MKRLFTVIVLLLYILPARGQKVLLLEKIGSGRKFQYESGDWISLKTSQNQKIKDVLNSVLDSSVTIGAQIHLKLNEISQIQRTEKFQRKFGIRLIEAGAIFIGITAINGLANNETVFQPLYLGIGGAVAATGVILIPLSRYNYKIGLRWKLKVMEGPLPGL